MFRLSLYNNFASVMTGLWKTLALQGLGCFLFAIIVLLWPKLLAIVVAAAFIFLGLLLVSLSFNAYRMQTKRTVHYDDYWQP